jgi:regulation of enolase protein 1 (concanavalin A-like superfamily)
MEATLNRAVALAILSMSLSFTSGAQTSKLAWEHEPAKWTESAGVLTETVPAGTDYWRVTHYGFIRDNGPFRYVERSGDFEAKVRISGQYRELYHQAGLMIRIDEKNWIKTGIEFVDGKQNLSAVVTREASDWSVVPRSDSPKSIWLRLQRHKNAVQIEYSLDDANWSMLRLAYFPPDVPVKIGMVAAAPGKQDFQVVFDHFSVGPLKVSDKK